MKIFKVTYSEFVPCYDIEVEADGKLDAISKAKDILWDTLNDEPEIWNVEEVKEVKKKKRIKEFFHLEK